MSINVSLFEERVPYLVSPYEAFVCVIQHVKLNVESGNGYPGQGGCFYGREGQCYVSQYRLVFVSDAQGPTIYKSFSLPYYAIRDWKFTTSFRGTKSWKGHINVVPNGGLISIGTFAMEFKGHGFDIFERHVSAYLSTSRALFNQFSSLASASILNVPGKTEDPTTCDKRMAYYAPDDPFTLYIIEATPVNTNETKEEESK